MKYIALKNEEKEERYENWKYSKSATGKKNYQFFQFNISNVMKKTGDSIALLGNEVEFLDLCDRISSRILYERIQLFR